MPPCSCCKAQAPPTVKPSPSTPTTSHVTRHWFTTSAARGVPVETIETRLSTTLPPTRWRAFMSCKAEARWRQTGLYGRSHGGMVIPLAAALSTDVAFIINVSGAGVSPHQQMTYQAEAEMRRDGFSEADIADAVAYMNQKWEVARKGGEGWDRLQAATQTARDKKWLARAQPATKLEDIVPSWKLQMGYDPLPALERVKCPILAVFGELDISTPVAQTTANYRKAVGIWGIGITHSRCFPTLTTRCSSGLSLMTRPTGPYWLRDTWTR